MSKEHYVTRRASLKSFGAMGAVMVLGGTTAAQSPAASKPSGSQDKPTFNVVDLAAERFGKGHACSQAVFSAVAEQMGMDYQTAVKVSAGFGGGMMLGSVCGAVTGAIMAIGLKRGGVGTQAGMETGKIVREFTDKFKAQHKTVNCVDLTGFDIGKVDLSKPEAIAEAYKTALAKNQFGACTGYVKDATRIVTELLNDAPKA